MSMGRITWGIAVALLLLVVGSVGQVARAQDVTVDLPIVKYNCPVDPGDVSLPAGTIPADCTRVAGVAFTVRSEAGTVLGTCTTDASGTCRITVPAPDGPTRVFVVEDVSTAPAGFVPRQNPVEAFIGVPEAAALVINIPAEEARPETSALLIQKENCPSAEARRTNPAACEPGDAGIRFEVMTTDGAIVGDCTTEAMVIQTTPRMACWVEDVPLGTVVVTEDLTTLPPGLAPLANSQTVTLRVGPEGQDFINTAVFVNIPVIGDEPPAEDGAATDNTTETGGTVALPDTGAGTTAAGGRSGMLPFAALIVLAGGAAFGQRRRRLLS